MFSAIAKLEAKITTGKITQKVYKNTPLKFKSPFAKAKYLTAVYTWKPMKRFFILFRPCEGELAKNNSIQLLKQLFSGGSITGTRKKRIIKIIDLVKRSTCTI